MRRIAAAVIAAILLASSPLMSQENAPVLTENQALKVQLLMTKLEVIQLRAQSLQRDFENTRAELTLMLKGLEVSGYDFDVQTLTYKPKPNP